MNKYIQQILGFCSIWAVILTIQMSGVQAQTPEPISIQATDDSFTRGGSKSAVNYGADDFMQAATGEGSNEHQIYLKYNLDTEDIPDLGMIKSAKLNLTPFGTKWGTEGSTTSVSYVQDDNWSEDVITYDTGSPAVTTENIGDVELAASETGEETEVQEIDITDAVKGETDKVLSLRVSSTLEASDFKANYHTKEHASGGAVLLIELSAPSVAFSASSQAIDEGGSVTFTDESLYVPTAWKWTFAGGSPAESTDQNPTVTYSTAGKYDVTLEATNSIGATTLVKTGYIVVDAAGEETLRIYATEDAFTRAGSKADTQYGEQDYMQAASGEGSNLHKIFLKYDLSEISDLESIISATLNLTPFGTKWGTEGSTTSVSYIEDDTWSEDVITYNTGRPTANEESAAEVVLTSTETGETVEQIHTLDVTDIVKGESDKVLSLELNSTLLAGTYKANYHSKEHSSGGAYLEIVREATVTAVDLPIANTFSVYPNPSANSITISSLDNQMERVVLYNLLGEVLKERKVSHGAQELNMSIADLSMGTYIIKAFDRSGEAGVSRVIRQ